jgi:hypothetical protein
MINRWSLSISTTAAVILFTLGASSMLEDQEYWMAGLSILAAFYVPIQSEIMRSQLLKREPATKSDNETGNDSGFDKS